MGLFTRLGSLFARSAGPVDEAVHIYVECGRCQARLHIRLDTRHDLSAHEAGGYFVRKEIMDSTCFRLMTAELTFDAAYRIRSQDLAGGRFLTREEFEGPA